MKLFEFLTASLIVAAARAHNIFKGVNLAKVQISRQHAAAIIAAACWSVPQIALADRPLNAPTAAGTRVNSDAESLLRYGLPFENKDLRDIQASIESAKSNLKTRRVNFAQGDVNNFKSLIGKTGDKILKAVPLKNAPEAKLSLARLVADIPALENAITTELSSGSGSVQERQGLDNAFAAQDVIAKELSTFEALMIDPDYKRAIPEEYSNLPALNGRAEVKMVLKKADGSQYDVDGKLYDNVQLKLVLDGYNAPLTAGNFLDLVNNHVYEKKVINRADGFVVQMGDLDPAGEVHGYVPPGSKTERKLPLEISLKGDKELLYGITSEDDGRGYAQAALPFQSYGALGMARSEFEADSASTQFFWLLFESDLTPAGKNLLDGRYACFGYTTEGADLLKSVTEGDIIDSIEVIKGGENLVVKK